MENVVILSTTSEKSKIRNNEIQYFIVRHFPFFRPKLSVVLNCTSRSEKGRHAAAVETPSDPEHEDMMSPTVPNCYHTIIRAYCTYSDTNYAVNYEVRIWSLIRRRVDDFRT